MKKNEILRRRAQDNAWLVVRWGALVDRSWRGRRQAVDATAGRRSAITSRGRHCLPRLFYLQRARPWQDWCGPYLRCQPAVHASHSNILPGFMMLS
ncbi:MAG: hypothetical protein M0Q87_12000, partial [Ottowia sp.]|nr:hypothetical protein [Ottowia sp.]